jgi:glycerol uptake facilitator-like aquaporin
MVPELVTEFIGSFVFFSVILTINQAIPIAIALLAALYFGSNVSGGNFNPAVSLMMYLKGTLNGPTTVLYILVQCLAAFIAYFWVTYTKENKSK